MTLSTQIDSRYIDQQMHRRMMNAEILARLVGVSPRTIRNLLKHGTCSPATCQKLYNILGHPYVPIVNDGKVIGSIRKLHLHDYNLPHRSCLLLLRVSEGSCRVVNRHRDHTFQPNRLDVLGEHECEGDSDDFPLSTLKRLLLRELGDEKLVSLAHCVQLTAHLAPYKRPGGTMHPCNTLEESCLFGLDLKSCPKFDKSYQEETEDRLQVKLDSRVVTLEELESMYRRNEGFADGLGKVVREIVNGTRDGKHIRKFIIQGKLSHRQMNR